MFLRLYLYLADPRPASPTTLPIFDVQRRSAINLAFRLSGMPPGPCPTCVEVNCVSSLSQTARLDFDEVFVVLHAHKSQHNTFIC